MRCHRFFFEVPDLSPPSRATLSFTLSTSITAFGYSIPSPAGSSPKSSSLGCSSLKVVCLPPLKVLQLPLRGQLTFCLSIAHQQLWGTPTPT